MTSTQQEVLLRASWVLLYAHYEGFVKNSLTLFYDHATTAAGNCRALPIQTKLRALEKPMKAARSLPPAEFLSEIERFAFTYCDSPPLFPEVDTKSNLWPSVLDELLIAADIQVSSINTHRAKLRALVSRRNDIAHGKNSLINEIAYYKSFESAVYDLMYELAYCVDQRLKSPPYI